MFTNILLASDGSPDAEMAAVTAAELACRFQAMLRVVHVFPFFGKSLPGKEWEPRGFAADVDPAIVQRWAEQSAQVVARHVEETISDQVRYTFRQENGDPADTILRIATEEQVDLIVLGCRGLGPALRQHLGSVSARVSQSAPCSVLIVRPASEELVPQ